MTSSNKDFALDEKEKENLLKEDEDKKLKTIEQKAAVIKTLKSSYDTDNSKEELIKIFRSWRITSQMSRDLKLSKDLAWEEYTNFDLSDIKYLDIVDAFSDDFVELNNSKELLKQTIISEYQLESEDYDTRVSRKIDVMSKKDIKKLLNWKEKEISWWINEREKLIKTSYWNNVPQKRNTLNFLQSFNLEEKRKKLNKSDKRSLDIIIWSFHDNMSFDYTAIHTLFNLDVFETSEKLEIIHTFSPTISLDKLIDTKIVSKSEWDKIKQKIIKEDFEKQWVMLYDKEIKALASKLKDDKVDISTRDYITNEKDIGKFVETWELKNVSTAYNQVLNKIKENKLWLDEFRSKLGEIWVVWNPNDFKEWQIIVIKWNSIEEIESIDIDDSWKKIKNKTKKTITFYAKIIDDWSHTGNIVIEEKWMNIYDSSILWTSDFSHTAFLNMLHWKDKVSWIDLNLENVDFYSDNQIKEKIRSWEIKSNSDNIEFKDKSELIGNAEWENVIIYNEERDKLINSEEYQKLEKDKWFEIAEEWLREKLDNNTKILESREELNNLENFNLKLLLDKIDKEDPKGSEFWFEEWTSFEAEWQKWKEKWLYTIAFIDKEKREILITSPSWTETIDFQNFYTTFKEKSAKRLSKIINSHDLLIAVQNCSDEKISWGWSSFEDRDEKISKKEDKFNYEYLVWTWWKWDNKLVKIHSINWNTANISFGELEVNDIKVTTYKKNKEWKKIKEEWKTIKKETNFWVESKSYDVTLGYLHNHILKHWLVPKSIEAEQNAQEVEPSNSIDGMKSSIASKLFQNLSIADVMAWFKLWTDSVEQYLKEWNDEHAAKFANWVLGKFLPQELKTDMLSRVESAQKKRMDEYSQKLKDLDTSAAVQLIEKWLLNNDCPGYKKEAGLMFMMEKYWNFYVKWPLYAYKNQFLWYQSLWWKIWDELYLQIKNDQESQNIPFTEEELVYVLLVKQCKAWWFNWVKRRWRLHKEFKALRWKWKDEEYQVWLRDGWEERTVEWRIKWWMNEFRDWSYSNAMWWIEQVVNKGWTFKQMNQIPFIMMFSWAAYGFESSMTDKIKNMCAKSMLIPLTRFMSFKSDIDLANETILEVSIRLWELYPSKYPDIWARAEKIFWNIHNNNIEEIEKIKEVEKFYEDYWDPITDTLYMLNDWDTTEWSNLNKLIFLEKDSYTDENWKEHSWNKKFKKYYDHFWALINADASFNQDEWLATDAFNQVWVSAFDMKKSSLELLKQWTVWNFTHKWWVFLWEEIHTELEAIVKRDYSRHWWKKAQEKILKDQLRKFISWLLENSGTRVEMLSAYNKPWGTFSTKFNKWGLNISKFAESWVSYDILMKWESPEWEDLLDNVVSNMLGWNDMSNTVEDYNWEWIGSIINNVQDDVRKVSYNDDS